MKHISYLCSLALLALLALVSAVPGPAAAHASGQGFVLLLPTGIYSVAGVLCVGLTVVLVALIPDRGVSALRRSVVVGGPGPGVPPRFVSLFSTVVVIWLIAQGLLGNRDPTANLLPLVFWTVFWVGLMTAHGVLGNLWRWLNPWSGLYGFLAGFVTPPLRVSSGLGYWPAVGQFLGFGGFLLADPAPADPARLAKILLVYWVVTMAGTLLFGAVWLRRFEVFGVVLRHMSRLSPVRLSLNRPRLGWPGWQIVANRRVPLSFAVLPLLMLAVGSFDGLNETFWWLDRIGINPFLFPGRSALVGSSLLGLLGAIALLFSGFGAALYLGHRLSRDACPYWRSYALFAPTVLPIAFGYHLAHYLPAFLVDGQYVALAVVRMLGFDGFYVTTSFFYNQTTVKAIWLAQAGAVVLGHMLAITLAHVTALRHFGNPRQALLSQMPLGVFMVAYTLFGLWLLAAPQAG